jgi:hypothetical protein
MATASMSARAARSSSPGDEFDAEFRHDFFALLRAPAPDSNEVGFRNGSHGLCVIGSDGAAADNGETNGG